jgi:hypothetical protein
VLRIPWQELDPSPEAGLVVTPGPSRVPGIINALATDVAAVDDASAAFLPHFPDQAVLERLARLDPAAEQVPVLLAVGLAGAENDQPGPGEADAISLVEGAAVPDGTEDRTRRRSPAGPARSSPGPIAPRARPDLSSSHQAA